nr:hypothetical protein CFP56_38991 [Quercus suber]
MRLALLGERAQALHAVLGVHHQLVGRILAPLALLPVRRGLQRRLGRDRPAVADVASERDGVLEHLGARDARRLDLVLLDLDEAVREPEEVGLGRADAAPGEDEVARARQADERGQAVGAAGAGQDADLHLRQPHGRARGEDAEVRAQGELEAAAQRGAGDGGDGGDRERGEPGVGGAQGAEEVLDSGERKSGQWCVLCWEWEEGRRRGLLVRTHSDALLQVGAGAKGMVALAGDDQGFGVPSRLLGMQAFDELVQLGEELAGQGIAGLGSVQGQDGDGARVRGGDMLELDGRRQRAAVPDAGLLDGMDEAATGSGDGAEHGTRGRGDREGFRQEGGRWVGGMVSRASQQQQQQQQQQSQQSRVAAARSDRPPRHRTPIPDRCDLIHPAVQPQPRHDSDGAAGRLRFFLRHGPAFHVDLSFPSGPTSEDALCAHAVSVVQLKRAGRQDVTSRASSCANPTGQGVPLNHSTLSRLSLLE